MMKKELRLYFTTPIAYGVVFCFLLITGYFFYSIFAFYTMASMQAAMNPQMGRELNPTDSVLRPLFSNMSVILLLLMPLVTMRLFAEERRSRTIELSIIEHFDTFAKGTFDTKDVIYYLNFTILALFIGLKSLEARRWKG